VGPSLHKKTSHNMSSRRRHVEPSLHKKTSHNMSSISIFVSTRTAKVSPRDRSCTRTEGRQRGRTRTRLPKTNFATPC
jgi:ribosomal protein L28